VSGGPRSPVPQDRIDELVRRLPDGRKVIVDAGHLVHARKPDAFIRELVSFLNE
jgi:pimeloyl-ACP methyl ester carboxylesterase